MTDEIVTLDGTPVFTFDEANVGTGIVITTTGYSLAGTDAGNYTLIHPTLSADITAIELTVTGLTGDNKVYDGNATATASGTAVLSGVILSQDVTLVGTPVFTFVDENVDTGIVITTTGYTLGGDAAGNYTLAQPTLSGNITTFAVTVTAVAANKIAGVVDPALTFTTTPGTLVGSEELAGVLTRVDAGGNTAGAFAIQQGTVTNANNPNYNITYAGADFTVNPALAAQVVFTTQPAGAVAGSAFTTQPVVTIQDLYGNTVDSAASVTIAIKPGTGAPGATLDGTLTVSAVSGEATFAGLNLDYAWTYVLVATSTELESGESNSFSVIASEELDTVSLLLNPGWNLISLPLIPVDSSITAVLDGALDNVISAWSYNAATETWTSWSPYGFSDLTTMVDGKGYWINMNAEATISFTGSSMPTGGIDLPPSYPVFEGWNLIGFKSAMPNTVLAYLTGTDYRLPIYWYGLNTYYSLVTTSAHFQPGLGYWVYFNADNTVTPSDSHPA